MSFIFKQSNTLRLSITIARGSFNRSFGNARLSKNPKLSFQSIRHVPNILSASRIFVAPITAFLIADHCYQASACLMAWSALSDFLDGHLARRFNLQSQLGSIMDPIGDKLTTFCVATPLVYDGIIPVWLYSSLLGRDIVLLIATGWLRYSSTTQNERRLMTIRPLLSGKIHTSLQFSLFLYYLIMLGFSDDDSWKNCTLKRCVEYLVALSLFWSTINYATSYKKAIIIKGK